MNSVETNQPRRDDSPNGKMSETLDEVKVGTAVRLDYISVPKGNLCEKQRESLSFKLIFSIIFGQ